MDLTKDTNFLGAAISHLSGGGQMSSADIDAIHKHILSWVDIPNENNAGKQPAGPEPMVEEEEKGVGIELVVKTLTGKTLVLSLKPSEQTIFGVKQKIERKSWFQSMFAFSS